MTAPFYTGASTRPIPARTSCGAPSGADASIGVGPEGIGVKAELFDIFSFARVKGLYGGLTLEGGGVIVNDDDNRTYYGDSKITPTDILIRRKAQNPQADELIRTITEASR